MDSLFRGIEFKVQSPQFEKTTKNGKRVIRGYASTDDLDRQNEIISREALEGAKKDLLDNVTVFMEHQHSMLPIGKVTDCILDDNGLLIEVSLSNAKFVDDIWTLIEERILNSFSIGGVVLDGHDERDDDGKSYHVIDKISILEVSVVGLPANPAAKFEPVYKSFNSAIVEQIKQKEGRDKMVEKDKKEIVKSEEPKEEVVKVEESKKDEEVVSEEVKEEVAEEKKEDTEGKKEEVKEEVVEEEKSEEEKVEEKVEEVKEEAKVEEVKEEVVAEAEASKETEENVVAKSQENSLEKEDTEIEDIKAEEDEEAKTEKSTEEKILDALVLIIEKLSALEKDEIEEKKEEPEAEKAEVEVEVVKEEIKEEVVEETKASEEVEVEKKEETKEEKKEEEPKRKSMAVVVPSPYEEAEKEKDTEDINKTSNEGWNKLFFGKK